MSTLRRVLCICFGAQALIFAFASPIIFRPLLERGHLPQTSRGILAMLLAEVVLAIPLVQLILCGMAWFTLRSRKPSGRNWAIAASIVDLAIALLTCVPVFFYAGSAHSAIVELVDLSVLNLVFLGLGIAGLIAFWPRNSVEQMPKTAARLPRIAGDGTSRWMDGLAVLLQIAAMFGGMIWWARWTDREGLPHFRPPGLLQIGLAALLAIFLHECGHSIAGRALGMRLRAFVVGPFHLLFRDGRWKFQFAPAKMLATGGAAALVPTDTRRSPRKQILMIAAGPLANLITGLFAAHFALMPETSAHGRDILALFSTISLVTFAGNLVPFQGQMYSDGARIYQILAGGPLADYNHLVSVAMSILVTPLRPRDYDIEIIQRTAQVITTGAQGFMLRLMSYSYFLDHGDFPAAAAALVETESVFQQVESAFPAGMYTAFVFGNAFVRRDAAAARLWWERMQAKKLANFNVDYWLAKSSLHWIEGDFEEADAAWKKASKLAERLPTLGAYESDRFACSLLRRAMDSQAHGLARALPEIIQP